MTDSTVRADETPPEGAPEPATDPVAALTKEVAELKDKHLRALAEMENLRRRTEREVVDADTREKADAGVKALLDGVELTERELLKVLEKHGIKKFEPLGEKFDPNLHQAMFEVPDPAVPPGKVVQVEIG